MPFEPGKSGNPGGRAKRRPFQEALMLEAASAERGDACEARQGSLRWNARKLLEQGDVQAIREIADRMDGKVPQAIIGDSDEDPINHKVELDAERFTRAIAGIVARATKAPGTE